MLLPQYNRESALPRAPCSCPTSDWQARELVTGQTWCCSSKSGRGEHAHGLLKWWRWEGSCPEPTCSLRLAGLCKSSLDRPVRRPRGSQGWFLGSSILFPAGLDTLERGKCVVIVNYILGIQVIFVVVQLFLKYSLLTHFKNWSCRESSFCGMND